MQYVEHRVLPLEQCHVVLHEPHIQVFGYAPLRIGAASTRYKDVFDVYYLLAVKGVDSEKLNDALGALVLNDTSMREPPIRRSERSFSATICSLLSASKVTDSSSLERSKQMSSSSGETRVCTPIQGRAPRHDGLRSRLRALSDSRYLN